MSFNFDIASEVFLPMEKDLKKAYWVECRDLISEAFLNVFKSRAEFGQKLHLVSQRACSIRVKSSTMATNFIKLNKIKQVINDPIQAIPRLTETLISLNGEHLTNTEMMDQLFDIISNWVGHLYLCSSTECNAVCSCKVILFDQAAKLAGQTFQELCKEERPGRALFDALCGTMVIRVSSILAEIDQYIPAYVLIDQHNCSGLRELLMSSGIGFQIIYNPTGRLWMKVDNDNDRCGARSFKQLYSPCQESPKYL